MVTAPRLLDQTKMGLSGYDPSMDDMRGIFLAQGPGKTKTKDKDKTCVTKDKEKDKRQNTINYGQHAQHILGSGPWNNIIIMINIII